VSLKRNDTFYICLHTDSGEVSYFIFKTVSLRCVQNK